MIRAFYDLHIHSALSPCADDDMSPWDIANMAALKGLHIAAVCDHNTFKNCPAFFTAAKQAGIIPVAGAEVTTAEEVHVLCFFENLESAMKFDPVLESALPPIANRPEI